VPAVGIEARHAQKILNEKLNKTDANDADGLARLAEAGFHKAVRVKSFDAMLARTLLGARNRLLDVSRTRMPGGVAGARPSGRPLCRFQKTSIASLFRGALVIATAMTRDFDDRQLPGFPRQIRNASLPVRIALLCRRRVGLRADQKAARLTTPGQMLTGSRLSEIHRDAANAYNQVVAAGPFRPRPQVVTET
jgi:hypothetical protein